MSSKQTSLTNPFFPPPEGLLNVVAGEPGQQPPRFIPAGTEVALVYPAYAIRDVIDARVAFLKGIRQALDNTN